MLCQHMLKRGPLVTLNQKGKITSQCISEERTAIERKVLEKAPGFVAIDDYECVHHYLELINVLGDGNCFWRALHQQVDRQPTGRSWCDLKDDVMRVLWQSNGQLGFVTSEDWALMCHQQSMDGAWASELSIAAAALLLHRPILVMSDHRMGAFTPCNAENDTSPIRLWCTGQHFQVVHRVSTTMGDLIASAPGMWRGGGKRAAAKREAKADRATLPPGDIEVDISDGFPRVVPDIAARDEELTKCKEELQDKTDTADGEVDIVAVMRRRRELPGAAKSHSAFTALFSKYEASFSASLSDVQKSNPDSAGSIRDRVTGLYKLVDDAMPLLRDDDPRLRRAVVCLLACYKLRITDYVILEQVARA